LAAFKVYQCLVLSQKLTDIFQIISVWNIFSGDPHNFLTSSNFDICKEMKSEGCPFPEI
jgi:hypothetical protein